MKIGILTFHRAENYGAQFQAYALYRYLLEKGVDVQFVDYWPTYHSNYFKLFSADLFHSGRLVRSVVKFLLLCISYPWRKKRKERFHSFMRAKLGLGHLPTYTNKEVPTCQYDVVLYGSDQIWRKHNLAGCRGFDEVYFGHHVVKAKKRVAFAASMGVIDLNDEDVLFLKEVFAWFDALSVREKNLQKIVEMVGYMATTMLDPVFLLSKSQWNELLSASEALPDGYIFYYNLLESAESDQIVLQLQKKTGYRVVEVTKTLNPFKVGARYHKAMSPEQFLSGLVNASYVVTNSFHGVALSVIFQKQFYACGMGNRSGRVESLLSLLEIEDRHLRMSQLPLNLDMTNYDIVSRKLYKLREQMFSFIAKEIDG